MLRCRMRPDLGRGGESSAPNVGAWIVRNVDIAALHISALLCSALICALSLSLYICSFLHVTHGCLSNCIPCFASSHCYLAPWQGSSTWTTTGSLVRSLLAWRLGGRCQISYCHPTSSQVRFPVQCGRLGSKWLETSSLTTTG